MGTATKRSSGGNAPRRLVLVLTIAAIACTLLWTSLGDTTEAPPSGLRPQVEEEILRPPQTKGSSVTPSSLSPLHWDLPSTDQVVSAVSTLGQKCEGPSRSYEPLGTFRFWGQDMNESSPCPTSGQQNQFTMLLALFHCASTLAAKGVLADKVFRWKDISCSPTGGREGKANYRVGSTDYDYAWFRWSEVFDVPLGLASFAADQRDAGQEGLPLTLCLADTYTWKEHREMASCSTNIGHLYGTAAYWRARRAFRLRQRYFDLVACFLEWTVSNSSTAWTECRPSTSSKGRDASTTALVAAHVRRGDYEHFCRGIARNSGATKYRTPAFLHLRSQSTVFATSKQIMKACAPDDRSLIAGLTKAVTDARAKATTVILALATNAQSVTVATESVFRGDPHVRVVSMSRWMKSVAAAEEGSPARPSRWPMGLGGGRLSPTDVAILDIALLASASSLVLNRYSTYSHTAVDERIVRRGSLLGSETRLYWW